VALSMIVRLGKGEGCLQATIFVCFVTTKCLAVLVSWLKYVNEHCPVFRCACWPSLALVNSYLSGVRSYKPAMWLKLKEAEPLDHRVRLK
jgi:hypothetical protein